MTQFKFGDRVLCGDEQFVYLHQDIIQLKTGWVISEEGAQYLAAHSALQTVPHPDTVRLDWQAKNDCALTERLCDEDGDLLDTSFAVIQKQEEHFEVLAAACDIREAIDAAMRHCAAETQEKAV